MIDKELINIVRSLNEAVPVDTLHKVSYEYRTDGYTQQITLGDTVLWDDVRQKDNDTASSIRKEVVRRSKALLGLLLSCADQVDID